jgi:hypothetical protein
MSSSEPTPVDRLDTAVRYVEVMDELSQIQMAWPALEAAVGSLRGRRFVAAFDPVAGWYRACVEVRADGEATPAELDLREMVIPGGKFVRVRLRGDPPGIYAEIGPAYERLTAMAQCDETRPSLEHYRRLDEIDVLMPVLTES